LYNRRFYAKNAHNGDGMNKFTLLRAAVLIIPQGILKTREFKKRFWAEMAARMHQLMRGMRGRFCDTFVLYRMFRHSAEYFS